MAATATCSRMLLLVTEAAMNCVTGIKRLTRKSKFHQIAQGKSFEDLCLTIRQLTHNILVTYLNNIF